MKKNYKSIDFGFLIDIDYNIKISNKLSFVILYRFNYGILNTYKNQDETNIGYGNNNYKAPKWKNINSLIGVGIKFMQNSSGKKRIEN